MKRWACLARFGGVGDNLMAASAARPLKSLGYNVEMLCSDSEPHTVFRNNPFIDKISVKKDGDIPSGDECTKWFASRAKEYDIFVNLSHSCEVRHALFTNSGPFWWPQEYRRKLCGGSYLETVHDIVGVHHEFGPLFFPTQDEIKRALDVKATVGERFVAWVVSGSRIDKIYPYAAMAVARIIKELDVPVVVFGVGEQQHEMATQLRDHVVRQNGSRDGLHLAVQDDVEKEKRWPLRAALTLGLQADLMITPDTGMAWAAAFERMPKLVYVSHASAENITKHWVNTVTLHADPARVPCWPCHRLHDTIDTCVPNADMGLAAACVSDISVEKLVTQASAMLVSKPTLRAVA